MSDIGLNFGPLALAALALIIGSPGLVIGAVVGAVAWRGHRFWGCGLGAFAGLALWIGGWLYYNDAI